MTALHNARVTVVGLGLMGGSLAGALKTGGACSEVLGVARRPDTAALAMDRGWVDGASTNLGKGVAAADVVVLATPVRTIIELLPLVGRLAPPGSLIMDLGSTKRAIVQAMSLLPEHVQPLGGHPMCGKETSGLAAAEPGLYQGQVFVLTPLQRTDPASLALARELVGAIGAWPLELPAERHDRLVAAVSHLPYLLACGLVRAVQEVAQSDEAVWQVAASGFRDTTRLAATDVSIMLDILLTNREPVLDMLNALGAQLSDLTRLIECDDAQRLEILLDAIRLQRKALFV